MTRESREEISEVKRTRAGYRSIWLDEYSPRILDALGRDDQEEARRLYAEYRTRHAESYRYIMNRADQ